MEHEVDEFWKVVARIAVHGRRPAVGWVGVLFLATIGAAIAFAYFRAAILGAAVPDMTAGMGPIAIALVPVVIDQITRHIEVFRDRAPGNFPGGGLVNRV